MKMLLIELAVAVAAECAYKYVTKHTGIRNKLDRIFAGRLEEARTNLTK